LTFEEPAASDDSLGSWIDNIRVIGGPFTTPKRYTFDAWDSFRSINDRNISTKIVNKPFTLSVASLDTANTALQDFNGTVCVQIIDTLSGSQLGRNCQVWNPLQSSLYTFTSPSATKNAAAKIAWKKSDLSGTFAIGSEDNATFSSDRFAIRPESFAIDAPDATAGKDFNITFTAPMYGVTTASMDYNETAGISFNVSIAEQNPACIMGTFTSTPSLGLFSFVNGSKVLTAQYSEVGRLDINISDLSKPCGSMYASIDCNDANVSDGTNFTADLLPIGLTSKLITIIPDHFDVNATVSNAGNGFTYLSDDLNMSAHLDLIITAENDQNITTKNYNTECYAQSTQYVINYDTLSITPTHNLTKLNYFETNTSTLGNVATTATSFNLTNLPKTIFGTDTNGTAHLTVFLNFDRNETKPVNPFDLTIGTVAVADNDAGGIGIPSDNATFVYGRVRAYDITTNEPSAPNPIEIEVYGKNSSHNFLNNKPQNVLYWYRNTEHSGDAVLNANPYEKTTKTASELIPTLTITTPNPPANGLHTIIVNNSDTANPIQGTIHLEVPLWLWYSSLRSYNDSEGSTCTEHPCFRYDYTDATAGVQGVNSGTFQGSDFQMAPAQNITNKGVKVFR
ncbi:hypothetical protein, partial [Sulfuricurvum sp.]|uniref:hypothetical protein n=1 Tax=Sulfuricurvum sp. TaxID=2025608 RepID=UPI00261FCF50